MTIQHIDMDQIVQLVQEKINALENTQNQKPMGVFENPDEAIEAAYRAQREYFELSMEDRKKITDSIKNHLSHYVEELSLRTVEETGMGRIEDKMIKNRLAIDKTPSVEDLRSGVFTGDDGLTLLELSPFGVIGAITPSTNPTETVICNTIGMVAAGNAVVFSPHPGAYRVTNRTVELINQAIEKVGGPKNLVVTVDNPSLEKANRLMKHEKISLLCATGGPGVVKSVLSSGKKAIGAGAGNPPVLVDKSADIEKAAKDIVNGASFDNNLPCIAEKEGIIEDEIFDYLVFNMKNHGAYEIKDQETMDRLEKLLVNEKGHPNKEFIGKDVKVILEAIGIQVEDSIRLLIMETSKDHPFVQTELMMPVLPLVRVQSAEEGIKLACEVEHGFRHTAICHSKNIDVLTEMGHRIQTTIFVKNGPSYAGIGVGGEGYTTFTIAGPTGEGLTSASTFTRRRRCSLIGGFTIR
ncbi:aldehyde dehydrogenase EutE [Irregularibacter muris]|uniref:Aldehyde dehydrogenase EutE n=1 Tax=Irregularibacter muris TaxID=1796619 RepID=A0AAE3HGX4_9FIRM|nr:aldehyde dehydrogenase family protein [Irregularibacter muris]MCR1898388.1 aldehyde dehydrogenase EutE [Irregularibacter muris]